MLKCKKRIAGEKGCLNQEAYSKSGGMKVSRHREHSIQRNDAKREPRSAEKRKKASEA